MDLFDKLFENKKQVIIVAAVYVVIVGIFLFILWKPKDKAKQGLIEYTRYTEDEINKEMANYYFRIMLDSFDTVVRENISQKYLEYSKTTVDSIISNYNIDDDAIVSGLTMQQYGNTNIYSSTINYVGGNVDVNIIETFPYEYEITFGSFIAYSDFDKKITKSNVEFMVDSVYRGREYMLCQLVINNNSDKDVIFDFSDSSKIYLLDNNGKKYYLDNNTMDSEESRISKKGTKKRELAFSANITAQGSIESLVLDKVNINGKSETITIQL